MEFEVGDIFVEKPIGDVGPGQAPVLALKHPVAPPDENLVGVVLIDDDGRRAARAGALGPCLAAVRAPISSIPGRSGVDDVRVSRIDGDGFDLPVGPGEPRPGRAAVRALVDSPDIVVGGVASRENDAGVRGVEGRGAEGVGRFIGDFSLRPGVAAVRGEIESDVCWIAPIIIVDVPR